jgi:hypothetical protein
VQCTYVREQVCCCYLYRIRFVVAVELACNNADDWTDRGHDQLFCSASGHLLAVHRGEKHSRQKYTGHSPLTPWHAYAQTNLSWKSSVSLACIFVCETFAGRKWTISQKLSREGTFDDDACLPWKFLNILETLKWNLSSIFAKGRNWASKIDGFNMKDWHFRCVIVYMSSYNISENSYIN